MKTTLGMLLTFGLVAALIGCNSAAAPVANNGENNTNSGTTDSGTTDSGTTTPSDDAEMTMVSLKVPNMV